MANAYTIKRRTVVRTEPSSKSAAIVTLESDSLAVVIPAGHTDSDGCFHQDDIVNGWMHITGTTDLDCDGYVYVRNLDLEAPVEMERLVKIDESGDLTAVTDNTTNVFANESMDDDGFAGEQPMVETEAEESEPVKEAADEDQVTPDDVQDVKNDTLEYYDTTESTIHQKCNCGSHSCSEDTCSCNKEKTEDDRPVGFFARLKAFFFNTK